MPTRAVKPKREDTMLSDWESRPERAPSVVEEDQPTVARFLALLGLVLTALGLFAVLAPAFNRAYIIGPVTGVFCLSLGLFFLIFHALTDRDIQYRLMYLVLGYLGIIAGAALRILPLGGKVGGLFLAAGPPSLLLGLIFVLATLRHETDSKMRLSLSIPLGLLGFAMIVLGSFAGHISQQFLLTEGVLISLIGLLYVASFLGTQGYGSEIGFRGGAVLGLFGAVGLAVGLARSLAPVWGWGAPGFFVNSGLVLLSLSLIYLIIGLTVCTDWPILVIFRREIRAFFSSPVGFLVLIGNVLLAWFWFFFFLRIYVIPYNQPGEGGLPEPVVDLFLFNPFMMVAQTFIVPVLTMRLLSEENRTGTLEVLLTAPLSESSLVLGKFFSAFCTYLVIWLPWFAFLLALRAFGGTGFEFRPLLSFLPAMMVTGMGFVAIGLFFSSVTSNQIIAAVLTFVVMILQVLPNLRAVFKLPEASIWNDILVYISPLDLWHTSLNGILVPRYFLYHVSVAVFFLFLTIKTLEARKWK